MDKLALIARDVGGEVAALMLKTYMGQRVYVPEPDNLSDNHHLVETLGLAAARSLAELYGGGYLEVPRGVAGRRADRNRAIMGKIRAGASSREVAAEFQLTERQVRNIRRASEQEGGA